MDDERLNYLVKNKDIAEITKLADEYYDNDDYKNAALCFYKLSELDEPYGYYSLGYCYKNGKGVEKSYDEAIYWYKKGADMKYTRCLIELGKMYYYGQGVEINYDEAYKYFYSASEYGYYEALYLGSKIVLDGLTKCGSPDIAIDMMTAAANDDYIDAIEYLALAYYDDTNPYINVDKEKGLFYLKKGTKLNNLYCMTRLGRAYIEDFEYEGEKGIELIEKAAESDYAVAYLLLGLLYNNCEIKSNKNFKVAKDIKKALNYYELAYENGSVDACRRLSGYYFKEKNYEKFKEYVIKGYNCNEIESVYNYGLFLLFGLFGIKKDAQRALEIIYEYSMMGYPPARKLYNKIQKKGINNIKDRYKKKAFKEMVKYNKL